MTLVPSEAVVLVVDDNPDSLFIITDLIEAEVGVRSCYSFGSAVDLFDYLGTQSHPAVDLILLDLQLPLIDGYSILARLQSLPLRRHARVVAVTANVLREDLERARAAGFDGFIGKPVDAQRFPGQIQRVLAGKSVWEAF